MKIERPDIIPDRFYTPLEAALLLEVNEQTLLKWSRYPSSGITRYHTKENHLLRFKGCDLLILWKVRNNNSLIFSPATSCYALLCPVMLCYVLN